MQEKFAECYLAPLEAEKTGRPAYGVSQAHRHDYYYCVLPEQGQLALEVDFQPVQVTNQSLFLSYPGQLHRIFSARLERGWYVAFAPTLLNEPLRDLLKQYLQASATPTRYPRRRPAEVAATLCVSASSLNDTIRAVTGFSVTYHLQQTMMQEAQRLLAAPKLPVNEVAYQLQFEDANYFNHLFRQVVGPPRAPSKQAETAHL